MSSSRSGSGTVRAVIFDLDGVIVDSHPVHKRCWHRFLRSCGKQVSEEDLDFVLDGRKKEEILRHFLGAMSREEVLEYGRRKESLFREEAMNIGMLAGLPEFLQVLQDLGIPMAVASSGSRRRVQDTLGHLGLGSHFRAVVTGDDVRRSKPDPTIFRVAARQLRAGCAGVLVVEDAVSGVLAAKRAGMRCLAIAAKEDRARLLLDAGADLVANDFVGLTMTELQELMRRPAKTKARAVRSVP